MRLFGLTVAVLIGSLLLGSCAQPSVVEGTINTQNQAELPAGAIVNVQLQDTSRADAPAIVLGEQVIQNPESFPVSFEIEYDPAQIDERHVYSMRVRIEVEGKLIFINTTQHLVITRGFPTELEVIVDDVAAGSPPTSVGLEDTTWVLMSFGEPKFERSVLPNTEITAEFFSTERTVKGSAGCNSYFGSYEVEGTQLSIPGPIAATEMACMEPEGIMDQEQEYLTIIENVETYEIEGTHLQINSGDKVLNFELVGPALQESAPAPPVPSSGTPLAPETGEPEPPATPPQIEVLIDGFAFNPATYNVPVGAIVVWYNNDSVTHTVTARDNSFDSGNLSPGDTFQYTFDQPGELEYYCTIHPSMEGTITIE
jgi:putative lipoprotein